MSNSSSTEQLQKELASIASSYTRIKRPKWNELLPFKESIRKLRKRGASFKTIAAIFRKQSINVSHDTVARFWHGVIEQPGTLPERPLPKAKTAKRLPTNHVPETKPASTRNSDRGPRIADTKTL